jgi:hypothetical protein
MKTHNDMIGHAPVASPSIARIFSGYGPKPFLEPEDLGGKGGDDEAAKGVAAALAAKEAADKAAADAAAKAAADAAALESAGKKTVDDEKAKLIKESMERKARIKELEEQLKAFDGVDAEAARKAAAEKAEAEKKALEKAGDFDRLKAMMADEHQKAIDAEKARAKALEEQLTSKDRVINELTLGSAFNGSAFINGELVLTPSKTRAVYGAHFDIEDGKVIGYDKPAGAAERTKLVDGSGNPLAFEDALKKLVDTDPDRERLIKSKLAAGAGSKTDGLPAKQAGEDKTAGRSRIELALAARSAAKK